MVSVNTNSKTLNGLVQGNFDGANVSSLSSNTLNVASSSYLANASALSINCTGNTTLANLTSSGNISALSINPVGNITSSGNISSGNVNCGNITSSGTISIGSINSFGNITSSGNVSVVNVNSTNITSSGTITTSNAQVNSQLTASKLWINGALLSDVQTNVGIYEGLRNTNDWRLKFVTPGNTEKPSIDFSTTTIPFLGRIEHDYNVNAINFYTSGTKAFTLDGLQNATFTNTLSAPTLNSSILNGTLGTASQPNITNVGTLGSLTVTNSTTTGTITSSGIICASLSSSGSVLVNILTASGLVTVYSLVSGPIVCSSLTSSGFVNALSVGSTSLTTSGFINYGNSQLNGSLTAYQIQSNSTITSSGLLTCPNAQINGSLTSSGALTCNLNVSNISDQTYPISFPVFTGPSTSSWTCYASTANPTGTAYYSASTSTNSWTPNSFSADSSGNYHGSATTTDNVGTWTGDYLTYNLTTDSFVLTGLTMYLWNNTTQMVVTVSPDNSTWTNLGVFNIPYVTDNNFINLSFPNNSTICTYTRLIFTKASSSPNIVSQVKLTCRGVASRMNSAGNINCRTATILGSLTSSGAISTTSTVTATGNINTVSGNLLVNNVPVVSQTNIGTSVVNSGLQNTSNSSFQIGSLFALLGRLNNIKIDYGSNTAGTNTGSQTMNITFSSAPLVFGQMISSSTANGYMINIYNCTTTSFSYTKKYCGATGITNSVSEVFYWLAIGS